MLYLVEDCWHFLCYSKPLKVSSRGLQEDNRMLVISPCHVLLLPPLGGSSFYDRMP